MKRFFKLITALCLIVVMSVSVAGCNLFGLFESKDPGIIGDSLIYAENVTLGTNEESSDYANYMEAYSAVARASVAITMTDAGSSGSGTIVAVEDGVSNEYYILTCHHVIDGMGKITVYVPDENCRNFTDSDYDTRYAFSGEIGPEIYSGNAITLVGGDKTSDVAVLKLTLPEGSGLEIVEAKVPSSGYQVRVAEQVFAIGNAEGMLPGTFTAGNIAYINREAYFSEIGTLTLLQINVDIWPGNSGGGLFNMAGELIGITNGGINYVADKEVCYSGINYAIPYKISGDATENGFMNIARQLIGTCNESNYGYISGRRQQLGFTTSYADGVTTITGVVSGSIAESAGLQKNDKILTANGVNVDDSNDLPNIVSGLNFGDELILVVERAASGIVPTTTQKTITMAIKAYRFCDTGT